MNWGNMIFNNFWPKVISLILAIATWFYVFDLVNVDSFSQRTESAEDAFARFKLVVKEVPVKPVFVGRSPAGYRVMFDKVVIAPSKISIFGPEEILENVSELSTDKINLGEYTRSSKLNLGLHSDSKALNVDNKVVDVYLPVEVTDKTK